MFHNIDSYMIIINRLLQKEKWALATGTFINTHKWWSRKDRRMKVIWIHFDFNGIKSNCLLNPEKSNNNEKRLQPVIVKSKGGRQNMTLDKT